MVGVDGFDGVYGVDKFLNKNQIRLKNKMIILDCCRKHVEEPEKKCKKEDEKKTKKPPATIIVSFYSYHFS